MNVLRFDRSSPIAGRLAPFVITLAPVLFLLPFLTSLPLLFRTSCAGALAFTLWWTPMLLQLDRGEVQIVNVQNLMAMGFTLLFIVPGIYLVAKADTFEAVRGSGQFTEYYPQALAMVSLAGFAFLVGLFVSRRLNLWRGKPSQARPEVRVSGPGLAALFAVALAVMWGIRLYLLQTGTYFWTVRSDFQQDMSAMLAILYTLDSMSYIVILTGFVQYLRGRWQGPGWVFAVIFSLDILWYLVAGSKSSIFKIAFAVLLPVLMYRRVTLRKLAMTAAAALLVLGAVIPVLNTYERLLHKVELNPASISIATVVENFGDTLVLADQLQDLSPVDMTFQRLADIRSLAAVYGSVPGEVGYIWGESYVGILFAFVPHIVWPDKPDFEIRLALMRKIIPLQLIASSPLTLVGESFVNFSFPGIVGVFFLLGILAHVFNRGVIDAALTNPWFGALLAVEGSRIMWTSMTLGQVVTPIARMLFVAFVLSRLMQGRGNAVRVA